MGTNGVGRVMGWGGLKVRVRGVERVGNNGMRRGVGNGVGRVMGNGVGSVMGWFEIAYGGENMDGNGGGGGDGVGRLMDCGGVMGSGVKVGEAGRK